MRTPRNLWVVILLSAAAALASCEWPFVTGCSGVGYWALRVAIRDAQGNPLALGATVTLYDGAYREQDSARYDPLIVYAAQERGGRRYDIQVAKRYYADAWVRGVEAPGGGCVTGREKTPVTRTVPVVLTLAPNAPVVRSIHLLPPRILLDRAPSPSVGTFTPYVDVNVGVSRVIQWRIAGDTSARFLKQCIVRRPLGTVLVPSMCKPCAISTFRASNHRPSGARQRFVCRVLELDPQHRRAVGKRRKTAVEYCRTAPTDFRQARAGDPGVAAQL